MSDDLVKRLRDLSYNQGHDLPDKAADRIEELGAANDKLSCDTLQLYARIETLERALEKIAIHHRYNKEMASIARQALEGKND